MLKLSDQKMLALLVAGLLLSWIGSTIVTKRENAVNAITEAGIADGYRYFFQFKNKLEVNSASRWRRPILQAADLKGYDSYFLISPKRPLSTHEGEALMEWVKRGGTLIVGFKDQAVLKRLQTWFDLSGIKVPEAQEFKDFQNGNAAEITGTAASRFSAANEKYSFYSYLRFED